MAGKVLLDTNIVVPLLRKTGEIVTRVSRLGETAVSPVTVGELRFGAEKSDRQSHQHLELDHLLATMRIFDIDPAIATRYGQIKRALELKGRRIPENDIWIAACAVEHGMKLITRDAHFTEVDGLILEQWI